MLEEQLKKFGLSDKEAKTYISLLVLGESSVTKIAEESGVNRSSAYVVLEALEKKGLASSVQGDGIQTFKAAPPEKLTEIAEEQAKKHIEIVASVKSIVPDLKGVDVENRYRPKIRVLEGIEGIKEAFEGSTNQREKEVRVVSALTSMKDILPITFMISHIKDRLKAGIKMYGIHPDDKIAKILMPVSKLGSDKPVLIPKEKYNFPADIAIYDNKIGLMSPKGGGYVIEIESDDISKVMRQLFDLAYERAQEIEKEEKSKR